MHCLSFLPAPPHCPERYSPAAHDCVHVRHSVGGEAPSQNPCTYCPGSHCEMQTAHADVSNNSVPSHVLEKYWPIGHVARHRAQLPSAHAVRWYPAPHDGASHTHSTMSYVELPAHAPIVVYPSGHSLHSTHADVSSSSVPGHTPDKNSPAVHAPLHASHPPSSVVPFPSQVSPTTYSPEAQEVVHASHVVTSVLVVPSHAPARYSPLAHCPPHATHSRSSDVVPSHVPCTYSPAAHAVVQGWHGDVQLTRKKPGSQCGGCTHTHVRSSRAVPSHSPLSPRPCAVSHSPRQATHTTVSSAVVPSHSPERYCPAAHAVLHGAHVRSAVVLPSHVPARRYPSPHAARHGTHLLAATLRYLPASHSKSTVTTAPSVYASACGPV
mmetsp:Transcript_24143/g.59541  ORF Transcript_24143/g.59541 Transcript_24143/m.59541 type:complete len:381 (+) Transcript_24143:718-1860(+)